MWHIHTFESRDRMDDLENIKSVLIKSKEDFGKLQELYQQVCVCACVL